MTSDPIIVPLPQLPVGPDPADMILLVPGLREALMQAEQILGNADEPEAALKARQILEQSSKTLSFIGAASLAALMSEMTDALETALASGEAVVRRACQALLEYLEDIGQGLAPHPLCLFSVYKDLRNQRGMERAHPADLVFAGIDAANLSFPGKDLDRHVAFVGHAARRAEFEGALLSYLRAADEDTALLHVQRMQAVVSEVALVQAGTGTANFWRGMEAAATALMSGGIAGDQYAKQFWGQVNLQLRRLASGTDNGDDRLLCDALFFIALASDMDSVRIKTANTLPELFQRDYHRTCYDGTRSKALAQAREQAVHVQVAWEKLLSGDASHAASFEHELAHLGVLCQELAVPALSELLSGMCYVAHDAIQAGLHVEMGLEIGLEMAKDLLFLDQCLRHIRHLPDHFPDQVNAVIQRLTSVVSGETPVADSINAAGIDAALNAEIRRDAMRMALAELSADVARAEGLLERHVEGDRTQDGPAEAEKILEQAASVAAMLELEPLQKLLAACVADIGKLSAADDASEADSSVLARLSHNLAALSLSLPSMSNMSCWQEQAMPYDGVIGALPASANAAETPEEMPESGLDKEEPAEPALPVVTPVAVPTGAPRTEPVFSPSQALAEEQDEVDTELLDVFLMEAQEVMGDIHTALVAARAEPDNMKHITVLRRCFHTIKGSGRMVGLNALGKAAMAVEDFLNVWLSTGRPGELNDYALLDHAAQEMVGWVGEIAAAGNSQRRPDDLIEAVERVRRAEAIDVPEASASSADVVAPNIPNAPAPADICHVGDLALPARLHQIYSEESANLLHVLVTAIAQWQQQLPSMISPEVLRMTHSLKSSSASVKFAVLNELARPLDEIFQFLDNYPGLLNADTCVSLMQILHELQAMQEQFAACRMPLPREDVQRQLHALQADLDARRRQETIDGKGAAAKGVNEPGENGRQSEIIEDTIDPELLEIFLEEGRDLLPQIGESLYKLQKTPGDVRLIQYLLRPLHTIKGSARMAGAMQLGQHMHELESSIGEMMRDSEPSVAMINELLVRYDQGLQLFEALQAPAQATLDISVSAVSASDTVAAQEADASKVANAAPLLRIRAGILDNLLNQAGEISISRSGMESEINVLRQHLDDLGGNVARLGTQLREIEIQAEIQIAASNQRQPQNQHFDPLEFDRFTHLQELTRMLAESVNDVASLQKNLLDTVEHTQNRLVQQARLTREMQRELMHARMVQFKGVEERLHRLVRQMSKETGKELDLDIFGSAVELDRSILEKMVGPFEHLLRNAAAHGIETAEQRLAAGKDAMGHLLLEVRQEGNEVMIRLSDDGQGLNLARIHEKAMHLGLIDPNQRLSDVELMGIIFHPGFSTSSNVTTIAGRGVGMDVVRSEVASLGGRISINTVTGRGAQFIIHLPLSLAVTQVVLLELGGQTYAIPSLLVEQVLQLKGGDQETVFRDGILNWQGRKLPVHYLSSLLGDDCGVPLQPVLPVMVVKSGHDFLAILVDRIIGNREVVTKSIGPQLVHMIGVVGATVLGSGSIVLILNPIQLAQHHGYQKILRHVEPEATDDSAGKKTVLVVDDSLTVRRVMHRLLTREGYRVVLATDGVDALNHLQELRPDIVLLDIEMPRMDGFDLTRHIRDMDDLATLPIIMITSRTAAKHRERAMELGVNAYLGKPYQDDVLLNMIHGLIESDGGRPEFCVEEVLFKPTAEPVPEDVPPSEPV